MGWERLIFLAFSASFTATIFNTRVSISLKLSFSLTEGADIAYVLFLEILEDAVGNTEPLTVRIRIFDFIFEIIVYIFVLLKFFSKNFFFKYQINIKIYHIKFYIYLF